MSAHTPGPWMTDDPEIWHGESRIAVFAEVNWDKPDDIDVAYAHGPDRHANARLIAAAPDLLEALQDLVDDMAERFDLNSPSTNPGIKTTMAAARVAIALATGSAK